MASLNHLPDTTQLALQSLVHDEDTHRLIATAVITATEAVCSLCHRISSRVRSHYTQHLVDLP